MGYTLGTIIALALVYLAIMMKKYGKIAEDNQPEIKQLNLRIKKVADGVGSETKLAKAARLRVEDAKVAVSNIKKEISSTGREIADEKQREEQIEMGKYKKEFKRKS
jgi:hypothetical protein